MSSSLRKLLIVPWFGPPPPWIHLWANNITRLEEHGYDVFVTSDRADFNERCADLLGVPDAIKDDGRKVCDFRCAFGVLYADQTEGYEFWGHVDLDMVYGRLENWITDEFLDRLDVHSNHPTYVSGPWSLYRDRPEVNDLFASHEDWRGHFENPATTGWVETDFSRLLEASGLRYTYTDWQAQNLNDVGNCYWAGDALMEGNTEIAMLHFRRTKQYPPRLIR